MTDIKIFDKDFHKDFRSTSSGKIVEYFHIVYIENITQ